MVKIPRSPVVVVMGHVDHGKSTLLDYIRKTNIVDGEAGGITQAISAYEVVHEHEGEKKKVTFLDTPGHEAFSLMRASGAGAADIAILVVSAEDGVKEQTKEALDAIKKAKIPFVVAINKIDKPNANIDRTKQTLMENEVYVEGYGGDIPVTAISAKEGTGIDDLLDVLLLVAELEELTGNPDIPATGFIIESHRDAKRGVSATMIIKDGTLKSGMFAIAQNESYAKVRIFEDFNGKAIKEATFSTPVQITGFSEVPVAGSLFSSADDKKGMEECVTEYRAFNEGTAPLHSNVTGDVCIPLVIRADTIGSVQAVQGIVERVAHEEICYKVLVADVGAISENDVHLAAADSNAVIVGFNSNIDANAQAAQEAVGATMKNFSIIYELEEWLQKILLEKKPLKERRDDIGSLKVLAIFNNQKKRQVIGGRMQDGIAVLKSKFDIIRNDEKVGKGKIEGIQRAKQSTDKLEKGDECGMEVMADADMEAGDVLAFYTTEIR